MSYFPISCALFMLISSASAHLEGAVEPQIPAQEKARITRVAQLALHNHDITLAHYQSTIKYLNARPCLGVDRTLTSAMKTKLSPAIAKREGEKQLDILQAFRFKAWHILYIATGTADDHFMFYDGDPVASKNKGVWGGGASIFETADIQKWTLANIAGIPPELASCFAWHVSLNRS